MFPKTLVYGVLREKSLCYTISYDIKPSEWGKVCANPVPTVLVYIK